MRCKHYRTEWIPYELWPAGARSTSRDGMKVTGPARCIDCGRTVHVEEGWAVQDSRAGDDRTYARPRHPWRRAWVRLLRWVTRAEERR